MGNINKICVIGAGNMGHQISTLCALHGYETGDPAELPSPQVVERFLNGEYGQKAGKGWYDYTK